MPHDPREDARRTVIAQPIPDPRTSLPPTQVFTGQDTPPPGGPQQRGGGVETRIVFGVTPELPPSGAARPGDAPPPARSPAVPADGPVVGWLVVVAGFGRGCAKEIHVGMNVIGREPSNRIAIDFGDSSISREKAAVLAYDPIDNRYTLMPGESANIVRLNRSAVYEPRKLEPGDTLTVGQTELRFVPLCGPDFQWEQG